MSDIFVYMPADVALDDRLTKTQLRVLIALYSFRKKNTDTAWPRREALASRCGLPLSRISTTTTELVELGWLTKAGNGGRSRGCEYQLTTPEFAAETVTDSVTVTKPVTVTNSVTKTVTKPVTKTVTDSVTGIEHANEQANEHATLFTAPRGKSFLAENFTPNAANEFEAKKLGLDLNAELEKFKAYWTAEGAAKADWQAALKSWLLNAHSFAADRKRDNPPRQGYSGKSNNTARTVEGLTGFKANNQGAGNERAINADYKRVD